MWFRKEKKETFRATLPGTGTETRLERHSATWRFVSKWATSELEAARIKNDSPSLNRDDTAVLRGRIKALKNLLQLGEDAESLTVAEQITRQREAAGGRESWES